MKSKLAIWSFIFGILSLNPLLTFLSLDFFDYLSSSFISWVFILFPLIGIVLGVSSLFIIRKNKLEGIWFAIGGIILSIIGVLLVLLWIDYAIAKGVMGFL